MYRGDGWWSAVSLNSGRGVRHVKLAICTVTYSQTYNALSSCATMDNPMVRERAGVKYLKLYTQQTRTAWQMLTFSLLLTPPFSCFYLIDRNENLTFVSASSASQGFLSEDFSHLCFSHHASPPTVVSQCIFSTISRFLLVHSPCMWTDLGSAVPPSYWLTGHRFRVVLTKAGKEAFQSTFLSVATYISYLFL